MEQIWNHHQELVEGNKLNESLIEQAWKEFCEKRNWTGKIIDGYTAEFIVLDKYGNTIYVEYIGE